VWPTLRPKSKLRFPGPTSWPSAGFKWCQRVYRSQPQPSTRMVAKRFPDHSPIFPFLNAIAGSLENIAPNKATELRQALVDHRVRLVIDQDLDRIFQARRSDDRQDVRCSIYGVEILWAASLGYIAVHQEFTSSRRGTKIIYRDSASTAFIPDLFDLAFNRRLANRSDEPWPSALPGPRLARPDQEPRDVELATELWLVALGWILHHELTHIRLGHLNKSDEEIRDEIDADQGATDWLLADVQDERVRLKMSLGIAIAVTVLGAFSLHRPSRTRLGSRTHPPAGERILQAMSHPSLADDHPAQQFACLGIKMHLDSVGVETPTETYETASDCLSAYCKLLIDWELGR
jgi:hypothetical protein